MTGSVKLSARVNGVHEGTNIGKRQVEIAAYEHRDPLRPGRLCNGSERAGRSRAGVSRAAKPDNPNNRMV